MPSGKATRKAKRGPAIKTATLWVLHNKKGSSFTIHYYDSKAAKKVGKWTTYTLDNHKKIYEITDDYTPGNRRLVVRRLDNHKTVLDVPNPSYISGDSFDDNGKWWLPGARERGDVKSICNSLIFNEPEGDFTYVGHQVFSFKLLENIPNYTVDYEVHLTPSGIVKPYIIGKKYVYSLRDKIAVLIASLKLDPRKYMNEQLSYVDSKIKTVPQIPFPVEMIDAGLG